MANTEEIIAGLAKTFFPGLKKKYPGLYISVQGEKKKMRESFSSLYVGFPLAMIGFFLTLLQAMFRLMPAWITCSPVPFWEFLGPISGPIFWMGV